MAIYEFFTSRNNGANVSTYVGQAGRLFYDGTNGVLKISDGITPGGSNIQLPVATTTLIGGIKAGPGANVALDGTLTIDTTGLPLSIGNLSILDTTIKTVEVNRDLFLVSNGTGNVVLIGEVQFYKPNGFPPVGDPVFRVKNDGQLRILVPAEDPFEGGIEVIGSATGRYIAPGQPGAMIHMTGNPGVPARMYLDGNAEYASFVARRFNGNVAVPTQVLANQDVFRLNATAATTSGMGNVALAQMRMSALEDQTPTAQGSKITFTVTPIGSSAASRVDVANVTVANGVSATKFTGPLTGNVVGNLTGTVLTAAQPNITSVGTLANLTVTGNVIAANVNATVYGNVVGTATRATSLEAATSILAGTLTIDPANINKTSASTQTFTLTGLTTNHKIVITSGTALTYGVTIVSAWASAADTLSINFHNYSGGGVDLGSTNIQYFAWV